MQSNSIAEYASKIPLATRLLFAINVMIFLFETGLQQLEYLELSEIAICLQPILDPPYQLYRIITSAFAHANIQHIGFNGLALLALGSKLEKQLGSLGFLCLSIAIVKLTGVMYLGICFALTFVPEQYGGGEIWKYHCAVGYSGVLFCYLYIDCAFSTSHYVCYNVRFSKKVIPWAFLAFTQALMWDSASFLGHLCGILVGVGYSTRLLCCVMPRYSCIEKVEGLRCWNCLVNVEAYLCIPQYKPMQRGMRSEPTLIPVNTTELASI